MLKLHGKYHRTLNIPHVYCDVRVMLVPKHFPVKFVLQGLPQVYLGSFCLSRMALGLLLSKLERQ